MDDRLAGMMLESSGATIEASERVMVLIDPSPGWEDVLRNGWRLASALRAELVVLAWAPGSGLGHASGGEADRLCCHRELAADLGARVLVAGDPGGSREDRVAARA